MEMARFTSSVILSLIILLLEATGGYLRACFYTNWSQFSTRSLGRFTVAHIPAQLCTHVIFAYADIRATNVTPSEFNDVQMYSRLNRLRRENPSISLILALGGWAAGGERFSRLVANETSMEEFGNNLVSYLRRYSFDGALVDWEYPGTQPGEKGVTDRIRFTKLLQILLDHFHRDANNGKRARLTLSAALEVNITEAKTFYEMQKIGRLLDFGFITAYDLHGQWNLDSGALHHAALNPDIKKFIGAWIQSGFPANKIVLGVTAFGRSFTLESAPKENGLGQPVTGGGTPGVISRTRGLLDFAEICVNLQRRGWKRVWLTSHDVPIAFGNTTRGWQWVGFDDPQSIARKARFIRQENLAGIMLWSLDHDDHRNLCGAGPWPLLRTMARELPKTRFPMVTTVSSPADKSNTVLTNENNTNPEDATPTVQVTTTLMPILTVDSPPKLPNNHRSDSIPQSQEEADLSTIQTVEVKVTSSLTDDPGYKQCRMAETIGPSMKCPENRGKPGDKYSFYLFCANGFFGIVCHCLPGHFFNRCISMCDLEQNFGRCPIIA